MLSFLQFGCKTQWLFKEINIFWDLCVQVALLYYKDVYIFLFYISVFQKDLTFEVRGLMVMGMFLEVLHHSNIFSARGQFDCSVPDLYRK